MGHNTSSRFAFAAVGALSLFTAPALAQTPSEDEIVIRPPLYGREISRDGNVERAQVVVNTSDLDLRSDADVDVLNERIREAVRLACHQLDQATGIDNGDLCRRDAQENAMRDARLLVDHARG